MLDAPQFVPTHHQVPHPLAHILLAEDDAAFRDLVAAYLRRAGYHVSRVPDGYALLARLAAAYPLGRDPPIDLVISDVYMPGNNGMQVLRGLTGSRLVVPVVLMTAFADPRLHEEALRHGARAVLDKPFELGALLGLVDRLCHPTRD
jgi:CheY-like chemotaxis protein